MHLIIFIYLRETLIGKNEKIKKKEVKRAKYLKTKGVFRKTLETKGVVCIEKLQKGHLNRKKKMKKG